MCVTSEIPGLAVQSTKNIMLFLNEKQTNKHTNSDQRPESGKQT